MRVDRNMVSSRERVNLSLDHKELDRIPRSEISLLRDLIS